MTSMSEESDGTATATSAVAPTSAQRSATARSPPSAAEIQTDPSPSSASGAAPPIA